MFFKRDKKRHGEGENHGSTVGWERIVTPPLAERCRKPRRHGLTMIIDKGLGCAEISDLMETAASHVDFVKLGFGTSMLVPEGVLARKVGIVRSHGVEVYAGGTLLEIALYQDRLAEFLEWGQQIGFTVVEVSDGTLELAGSEREGIIREAVRRGYKVLSEVGKKDPSYPLEVWEMADQIHRDLVAGAFKVIIEAREAGKGIGIFDGRGEIIEEVFSGLARSVPSPDDIIWEAPQTHQQKELISRLGPNVNLGNIPASEVIALEALREGLRSDTFRTALEADAARDPSGPAAGRLKGPEPGGGKEASEAPEPESEELRAARHA